MESLLLQAVVRELREDAVGAVLTRLDLLGDYALLLRLTDPRADLFLSAHPELSRVSRVRSPRALGEPSSRPRTSRSCCGRAPFGIEQEHGGRVAVCIRKPGPVTPLALPWN
jgi:hypothetical protein